MSSRPGFKVQLLPRILHAKIAQPRHVRYLPRNALTRTLEEKRFIPKKSTLLIPADSDAKYVAEFGWTDDKVGWWIVLRVACHQKRIVCTGGQDRTEEHLVVRVREMVGGIRRFHQLAMRDNVIDEVMNFIF